MSRGETLLREEEFVAGNAARGHAGGGWSLIAVHRGGIDVSVADFESMLYYLFRNIRRPRYWTSALASAHF